MEAGVRDPWNPGEASVPECPLCSGQVARGDPAAQALDWGVRTAEARGGESGFWKAAVAADVSERRSGDSDGALLGWVDAVRLSAVEAWGIWRNAQGQAGGDALLSDAPGESADRQADSGPGIPWTDPLDPWPWHRRFADYEGWAEEQRRRAAEALEDARRRLNEFDLTESDRVRFPPSMTIFHVPASDAYWATHWDPAIGPHPDWSKKMCCPELVYPDHVRKKPPKKNADETTSVGFRFVYYVEFKQDPACACKCCLFKQYVKRDYMFSDGDSAFSDIVEDCNVVDSDGEQVSNALQNDRPSGSQSWDCYPATAEEAKAEDARALAAGGLGSYKENGRCRWRAVDEPEMPVPWGASYFITWQFIGRVYDLCRDRLQPVLTRSLRVRLSGRLGSDGDVEQQSMDASEADVQGNPVGAVNIHGSSETKDNR